MPSANSSPKTKARVAGLFYLLVIITAPLAMFVLGKVSISNDAVATAVNISAHQPLYRAGYAADISSSACYLVVTALFFELFNPVNRSISLIALLFSLIGIAVGAVSGILRLAPLVLLGGTQNLSVFRQEQLQSLALFSLQLRSQAVNIGIVFFGFYCLLIGYLVWKSTFIPRIIGLGMALAGMGWLSFLYLPLAMYLAPYNQAAGGIGEISLTLWLLIAGVNVQRWDEQARLSKDL